MEGNCEKSVNNDGPEVKLKGKALLIYDLKQRRLIPTKILFFVVLSSIGVLLPYMTIHMKSLGISVEETAIIYGVFPLFSILAPYTMGIIADKLGNFKVLLCVTMLMAMANALLFLVIPTGRFIEKYPANLSMAVGCGGGRLVLTDLDSKTCGFRNSLDGNLSLTVTECGYVCYDDIHQRSRLEQDEESSLPADWPSPDQPHKKFRHGIFFPDNWGLEINCSPGLSPLTRTNCSLNRNESPARINSPTKFNHVTIRLNQDTADSGQFPIERTLFNGVFPLSDGLECSNSYDQPIKLVQPLVFTLNGTLKLGEEGTLSAWTLPEGSSNSDRVVYRTCRSQCLVQTKRKDLCGDDANVIVYDPQLTFWLYLLLRLFFAILLGGSMVLFEGACLAVVIQYKGDLGLQRMFGILGTMIFCPVSGALIDYYSINQDIPDYRPAFYLYAVLVGSAAVGVLTVDLDFRPPAKELLKDIKSILANVELLVFFVVIFTSGLFWGYIESYLFWFLEEMGGTKSLMGLTVTVSSFFGIPALILSDVIFRRIGHPNVQIIGFAFYVIRLIGYSYIYNPYMCLIYEALEAITTSLMMTSAVAYSAELSTPSTLATIQGMVGGTYYGIGRGLGSFVGGFLMKFYGTRSTFRILGAAAFFVGLNYFFFNLFYIRRKRLNKEKVDKKTPDEPQPDIIGKKPDADSHQQGLNNPVFVPDDDDVTKRAGNKKDVAGGIVENGSDIKKTLGDHRPNVGVLTCLLFLAHLLYSRTEFNKPIMLLKENELVFRDYEWTSNDTNTKVLPNSNVQVVSPFFSLDHNNSAAENDDDSNSFRFGIRLSGNSIIFDKFQTVVYFYAHKLDNVDIRAVECLVANGSKTEQTIRLQSQFPKTQVIRVFRSEEFQTYDHLSDKGISLKFRVYMANNSNDIRTHLRFELRDAHFGREMWSAAQKGQMTDCEFVVKGHIFTAHRAIVAARCPVLACQRVDDDCSPESFKALLYFIYTGCLLPGMSAVDRRQFDDLADRFQLAIRSTITDQTDGMMTRLFMAMQPKLKSRDQSAVEIREDHGRVSQAGRGLCLHFDYVRTLRSGETVTPEVFRLDGKGFFGVTLTENPHKNGHNYQLTFSSCHLVGGFKLASVIFDIKDGRSCSSTSPPCNMTKMLQVGGGDDDETLKVFREGISLPIKHSDSNHSPAASNIHVNFTVHLTEVDQGWGYRLHDPRLPAQLWSAAKRGISSDVQLRVGRRSFGAHRAILSARSSVFAAILKGDECDSWTNDIDDGRLSIIDIGEDVDPDVFQDFLVFVYTGRLRTTENMGELWAAANKYDVKTLERIGESVKGRTPMEELCVTLMSSL